ncbi:CIA30 family protein [Cellulophaga fucicola]|uniref:Complex I intermediate-associated protein 30 (CIA30) n=1 Tax=Cellulophaga fucicola TaxID=76595 RepID=A0A1K1LX24_9FLAO|nr:CIA30 family protein [Cellulophaga fucicola]SFW15392.1 Complex I intermediate-associated protein 30 (CIA30) [Cellulophaga fucicola]
MKTIIDFTSSTDSKEWHTITDAVMGGVSKSNFEVTINNLAIFNGHVSLDNNGGFAMVKHSTSLHCKNYTTICITLKGDGKAYQFRIKENSETKHWFIAPFSTNGEWQTIEIKLSNMYAMFRGNKVDIPNFSAENINEIAFLIGNKTAEDFKLELKSIALK